MDYRERFELKDYLKSRTLGRRILLFQAGLALVVAAFVLDFWYLQVARGRDYAQLADNNRLRRVPLPPVRGVILDRERNVLASTRPSLDLVLLREDPAADLDGQLRRLAPILDVSYRSLAERKSLVRGMPSFEPLILTEDVGLEQLARIEARRELFPSVAVREGCRRHYPQGEMFGHVLGYVGEASQDELARGGALGLGEIVGKSGLERGYDELLRGTRGWSLVTVNNVGRRMGEGWVDRQPQHGKEVQLTVDSELQRALMRGLGGEVGAGVFLDPWTGDVLALGSTPSFDPNLFANGLTSESWRGLTEDPRRPLLDRAIASYYAPGSVFKVLMSVAGLEAGAVTPNDTVFCTGSTTVYGTRRLCWKHGGHGRVDLRAALTHSCNVYFYQLGKKLGIEPIERYGREFGLGRPTGIDLPGEAAGVLPSPSWKQERYREPWYPGDTISVAIGQGLIAVTPIQLATLMSAVATGGNLPRPHLIKGTPPQHAQLALSPETVRVVREALRNVVEQGTGARADLGTVPVAGKTGTAQVFKRSAGIDADRLPKDERDHAWFAGYAPADRPQIAFAVVIEHGGHGGTSAAPVVRAVLEAFFQGAGDRREAERAGSSRPHEELLARAPAAR